MNANATREKSTNELMTECKVFWAFSDKQFAENKTPLKEGEKYVSIGAGGYMPKSEVDNFTNGMKAISKTFKQAMKDKKAREAHIRYELNNHEAYWSHNIESALEALGSDFTSAEVLAVFDGRRMKN